MSLTIATFNLKNLIEAGKKIYTGKKPVYTEEEYSAKIHWIGERLRELDSDIIGFQEVWQVNALLDCFKSAGLENEYDIIGKDSCNAL